MCQLLQFNIEGFLQNVLIDVSQQVDQTPLLGTVDRVSVPRVDTAIDCGFAANPERIRSQIEGAAVMGMSLALYGEISFKKGRVEQSNYDSYRVLRIDESPSGIRRTLRRAVR